MLNFLYSEYPYGKGEIFVDYEMRALAENKDIKINIYTLCDKKKLGGVKRFVPENARVIPVCENKSLGTYILAFFSMFLVGSLKEIANVFKEKHSEGVLKCLYRIFSYNHYAAMLANCYKKERGEDENDIFISYWLNECAFSAVKLKNKYRELIVTSRGHGFDIYKERCYLPFRRTVLSNLDRIYLINQNAKSYFESNYGMWLDTSKIEIEHLGVTMPEKVTGVDGNGMFRVVSCSSVIQLKRLDLLIDALSLIKDKDIEWVHIGGGPLFTQIKSYAEEKLKNSSVKYIFMGQKNIADIQKYYGEESINLFVNCSDTEGTPVAVMEAMSYGIPAVARAVGGNGEAIDESCGMLIPSEESAIALKEAIEAFYLMDKGLYMEKRFGARQKIELDFNADITYEKYINKIRILVKEEAGWRNRYF